MIEETRLREMEARANDAPNGCLGPGCDIVYTLGDDVRSLLTELYRYRSNMDSAISIVEGTINMNARMCPEPVKRDLSSLLAHLRGLG